MIGLLAQLSLQQLKGHRGFSILLQTHEHWPRVVGQPGIDQRTETVYVKVGTGFKGKGHHPRSALGAGYFYAVDIRHIDLWVGIKHLPYLIG